MEQRKIVAITTAYVAWKSNNCHMLLLWALQLLLLVTSAICRRLTAVVMVEQNSFCKSYLQFIELLHFLYSISVNNIRVINNNNKYLDAVIFLKLQAFFKQNLWRYWGSHHLCMCVYKLSFCILKKGTTPNVLFCSDNQHS